MSHGARATTQTVSGFLLHSQPYRESESICTIISPQLGRFRCRIKASTPEFFREIQLKLTSLNSDFINSDFRYLGSPLVLSPQSSFFAMYVNELAYRLAPKAHMDSELYGCYMSTLIQLNMPDTVHQTLRYFEMRLLSANGSAVDFNFDASNEPIDQLKSYNFIPNSGFVQKKSGRYLGSLITSAGNLDVAVKGAMAVARECMAQQLDALLGEQPLVSRQWRLPQRKEG